MKTTVAVALPRIAFVPIYISSDSFFSTGIDSPVKIDSSHEKSALEIILQSAGILSPALMKTTSSGTIRRDSISTISPSRITFATGGEKFLSAFRVRSVLYSWINPKIAFNKTMQIIVSASKVSPIIVEITVLISKMTTIKSLNCPAKIFSGRIFLSFLKVFSPYFSSCSPAFLFVKPFGVIVIPPLLF